MWHDFRKGSIPYSLWVIPLTFAITPLSKIAHPARKKEKTLNIYEIIKLLQYNYHHMKKITEIYAKKPFKIFFRFESKVGFLGELNVKTRKNSTSSLFYIK